MAMLSNLLHSYEAAAGSGLVNNSQTNLMSTPPALQVQGPIQMNRPQSNFAKPLQSQMMVDGSPSNIFKVKIEPNF